MNASVSFALKKSSLETDSSSALKVAVVLSTVAASRPDNVTVYSPAPILVSVAIVAVFLSSDQVGVPVTT
ncbi:hypothetical protein D3C85_1754150 [compost metagenome]